MDEATLTPPDATTTEKLRHQTKAVKEDVAELGRLTKDVSREKLLEAKEFAGDKLTVGKERFGKIEDDVVNYVREKPVKSVLISAGVGALLGFLLSRR